MDRCDKYKDQMNIKLDDTSRKDSIMKNWIW